MEIIMALEKKVICPYMSTFNHECVEDGKMINGEIVACRFWVYVHGKHPQTGEEVKNGDCAVSWMPVLLIENSKVNRETGAAIESARNVSAQDTQMLAGAILSVVEKVAETTKMPTFNILNSNPPEKLIGA